MATTYGSGTPAANYGADGDYFVDNTNRVVWGPKAGGSWVGTGSSLTGPTGPGLLFGKGSPLAAAGPPGSGYMDLVSGASYLKGASGWAQQAGSPFQGPAGQVGTVGLNLAGQAANVGPQAAFATATTTTNNQVIPIPGTTLPQTYIMPANALFAGLAYLNPSNSGSSFSVNLYDQTAGTVLYSTGSISTGSVLNLNKINTPIAMTAGNQYVWRISAGSNILGSITPYFLLPATSSVGPSMWPTVAISQDVSYSATQQVLRVPGASVAANGPAGYVYPAKAGFFQYATITVTGSASVQLVLKTGTTTVYTSDTFTSANTPANTPIYASGTYPLAANTPYLWYAQGGGSGQVFVNTAIVS